MSPDKGTDFKRLDDRTLTGQKGIALIERIILRMGLAWHARNASLDAGIDGTIEVRDVETQRATNCILQVQSKAVTGRFTAETDTSFEFLCDARDINYWLGGNVPVILVVSRPDSDEAYWISVRDAFATLEAKQARRVAFDKQRDRFNESCRAALVALAVPRASGLYFPPPPRRERLLSNLLPVTRVAEHVYLATTDFRRGEEVWARAKANEWEISGEWHLHEGRILSFHNLREEPWRQLCDPGTAEEFGAEEWSESEDFARRRIFVRLLNEALRSKLRRLGVGFNSKEECYWFLPPLSPKQLERKCTYQSLAREATRTVVRVYRRKDGTIKYHRHNAFKGSFERYDQRWYLEITPTYFFTRDGRIPSRFGESLLQGIKRVERNHSVIGQVITWARFLTQPPDMFGTEYPFLGFGALETVEVDCGVDDQDWLSRESEADRRAAKEQLGEEGLFS